MARYIKSSMKKMLENPGIDPGTSHMLSERSTTWANSPDNISVKYEWHLDRLFWEVKLCHNLLES